MQIAAEAFGLSNLLAIDAQYPLVDGDQRPVASSVQPTAVSQPHPHSLITHSSHNPPAASVCASSSPTHSHHPCTLPTPSSDSPPIRARFTSSLTKPSCVCSVCTPSTLVFVHLPFPSPLRELPPPPSPLSFSHECSLPHPLPLVFFAPLPLPCVFFAHLPHPNRSSFTFTFTPLSSFLTLSPSCFLCSPTPAPPLHTGGDGLPVCVRHAQCHPDGPRHQLRPRVPVPLRPRHELWARSVGRQLLLLRQQGWWGRGGAAEARAQGVVHASGPRVGSYLAGVGGGT